MPASFSNAPSRSTPTTRRRMPIWRGGSISGSAKACRRTRQQTWRARLLSRSVPSHWTTRIRSRSPSPATSCRVGKNTEDALDLFDQALALNPSSAFAWGLSALTLAYLGRCDEALERLKNVWRLNPFDPLNFYFWIVAGIAEFVAGRYDESIVWLRKSKCANPRFVACLRTLTASLALAGEEAEARLMAQELLEMEPSFRISSFISWYPLRREDDLARLASGLRIAGLPE